MGSSMDISADENNSINAGAGSNDFIAELNEQEIIWKEDSADRVIDKFSELVKLKYKAEDYSIYRVFDRSNIVKIVNLDQCSPLTPEKEITPNHEGGLLAAIEDKIRNILLSDDISLLDKIQTITLGVHGEYLFFCLGLHLNNQIITVWKKPEKGISDEIQKLSLLVQHELSWYRKFDLIQAHLGEDDLTQLKNYRSMNRALDFELKRADRFQYQFSVLFIDLDNFKSINDSFGHAVGSEVLKKVGYLMKSLLREVDSVFRYGGDEFVLLLLGADRDSAKGVASRVRDEIATCDFSNIQEGLHLTVSIGLSVYPDDASSKEELLKLADQAMYLSKNGGKNSVSTTKEILEKEFSYDI